MTRQNIAILEERPQNIIVRMPNWLGDCVMATPILEDLHHFYPDAKITAMCQEPVGQIVKHDPNIEEILQFKKISGWVGRSEYRQMIDSLRKGKYDLGILLTNSFSSAWWLWKAGVKHRIGYKGNFRSLLLTKGVPFPLEKEKQHLVTTYKMLLCPLGIAISDTPPTLYLSSKEEEEAKKRLEKCGINPSQTIIGINPGAAYGSAKCWLPERFRNVTKELLKNPDLSILYFGNQEGRSLVENICEGLGAKVLNLAGKTTVRELISLINLCDLFLTNDSGPMHIASALQVPLIALFGSTNDVATGPYGGGKVIHKHVSCSPCYLKTCPIDFRCMKEITEKEVLEQIEEFLEKKKMTKVTF